MRTITRVAPVSVALMAAACRDGRTADESSAADPTLAATVDAHPANPAISLSADEKIEQAMHTGTERTVPLKQPLPVYLVYFTAWEQNGAVQFGTDVYGYDRKQSRDD